MSSSNTNIPTSTSVLESVVIRAPLSKVWHFIKLQDFGVFWSALSKSEVVKDANNETDVFKWTFKDGTVYEVKQEEHSVCIIASWSAFIQCHVTLDLGLSTLPT